MTHPTAWTATELMPTLPRARSALLALYALREATRSRIVTSEHLYATINNYHTLSGSQTRNVYAFDPYASHGPEAYQVLHQSRGQVVTFDDGSALLLRRHGQRYALSNTIAHTTGRFWNDDDAAFALEHLWTPAHLWPTTHADWNQPATGIEMAMPITPPQDPKRDTAFATVADLLWDPTYGPRPGFRAIVLATTDTFLLAANGGTSGAALEPHTRWRGHYNLLEQAARTLYTGRRAHPQAWVKDIWSSTTLSALPCVHVPPQPHVDSAHRKLVHQRDLYTKRMPILARHFPELHARITTALHITT